MQIMNDRLYKTSIRLVNTNPFYHEIFLQANLIEMKTEIQKKQVPTMGVNTSLKGLNMYYNPDFLDKLDNDELYSIVIHEIYHFLFDHQERSKNFDKFLSNCAQDMIINCLIKQNIPNSKFPEGCLYIPEEYKDKWIFEKLYEWLQEKKDNQRKDKEDGGDRNKDLGKETKELLDKLNQAEDNGKECTIDVHLSDDISPELKKQIMDDIVQGLKARGLVGANEEQLLNGLRRSKKDHLKIIKRILSGIIGTRKHTTWAKPNRKDMPVKGFKKYKNVINCLLDTSGSMGGTFDKVLSYIFQNDIKINLIQCDTEVKKVHTISNKNELKKMTIHGLGGTILQPGIDYIAKHLNTYPIVVLSDGYTDTLDFSRIKSKVLIITSGDECPIKDGLKKVIQIKIEKED